MNFTHRTGSPFAESSDALIIPSFSRDSTLDLSGLVAEADAALGGELATLAADARFSGKRGTTLVVSTLGKISPRRIVLAGVGSAESVNAESIRRAWGTATSAAREAGARNVTSVLPPIGTSLTAELALASAVEAASLASYRFTNHFGTARKDELSAKAIDSFSFIGEIPDAESAIARGSSMASGVALARNLVNEPGSVLTPELMADYARQIAKESNLEIKVFGPSELEEMGAGGIVNVGKGSTNEPRLIHLIYRPEGSSESTRQIGLVGKCITFDTGGYSLKPHDAMLNMKGDMAGGAAVLGAMSALRAHGCPNIVHGVITAAENMISGNAFRPDDILTAMNGVTMEILSTDAEGRLVLADGLVYTARQGADELIDLATLTGAIVVALGEGTAGLFCNDDELASRIHSAASESGERVWRMPLTEELNDQIKGDIGDIKNTGGRAGGAITAALFLQHFCEGLPWAHLDIAGCNKTTKASAYTPKGATGWGVRTLVEYVGKTA